MAFFSYKGRSARGELVTGGLDGETAEALFKMLEALEDSDDVQNVFANFEVSDDVMARLSA